jgi:hypothetical protein
MKKKSFVLCPYPFGDAPGTSKKLITCVTSGEYQQYYKKQYQS